MQCTCRKEIERRLTIDLKAKNPGSKVGVVSLEGYEIVLDDALGPMLLPTMEFTDTRVLKAKNGGRRLKRIKYTMLCKYCPHCGKPAKKTGSETPA